MGIYDKTLGPLTISEGYLLDTNGQYQDDKTFTWVKLIRNHRLTRVLPGMQLPG